jgi:hypothetical protein
MTSENNFDDRMDPRLRRVMLALAISAVGNVALIALVTMLDTDKHPRPTMGKFADGAFAPGDTFAKTLIAPGHDAGYLVGVPLIALAFSIVFYAVFVWVIINLPGWWRNRA